MSSIIPHVITPKQAAEALGIDVFDLAERLRETIRRDLGQMGDQVARRDVSALADELERFDERLADIRRLLASAIECDKVWTATVDEPA